MKLPQAKQAANGEREKEREREGEKKKDREREREREKERKREREKKLNGTANKIQNKSYAQHYNNYIKK